MAAPFSAARSLRAARTQPRPSGLPTQNLCPDRATGPGAAPEAAHFRSGPFETRVRSHHFAYGHPAHLAGARIDSQTQKKISAQTGSGLGESDLAPVPTNLRRYQGSMRYSAVLAPGPEPAFASGGIHGAGSSQRFAVLGLRAETLGSSQRRLRRAHPAAPGSL